MEEGLEAAINDRPWPGQERKLDGRQEAHLIAFACSAAPEGHTHWTLQLLADQVVELEFAGAFPGDGAPDTQKNELKPWKKKEWCIPKVSGEFVARMEDVLDLYQPEYTGASGSVFRRDLPAIDWGGASRLPPDGWHAMTSTSETGPGTCS